MTWLIPLVRADQALEDVYDAIRAQAADEKPAIDAIDRRRFLSLLPGTFRLSDLMSAIQDLEDTGGRDSGIVSPFQSVKHMDSTAKIMRLASRVQEVEEALASHVKHGGRPWSEWTSNQLLYKGGYRWHFDGGQDRNVEQRQADEMAASKLLTHLHELRCWLETVAELDGAVRIQRG